jgi:hypothetical protein
VVVNISTIKTIKEAFMRLKFDMTALEYTLSLGYTQMKVGAVLCSRALAMISDPKIGPNVVPQDIIIGTAIKPPEQRFDLLQQWIRDCNEHHPHCSAHSSKLPTRVIDIGEAGSQEPLLRVTNGEHGEYVALSHCWGSDPVNEQRRKHFHVTKYSYP